MQGPPIESWQLYSYPKFDQIFTGHRQEFSIHVNRKIFFSRSKLLKCSPMLDLRLKATTLHNQLP